MKKIKVSCVQMRSCSDRAVNIKTASNLIRKAAGEGADLIVLPETFDVCGPPHGVEPVKWKRENASLRNGQTIKKIRMLAMELNVTVYAGSILFYSPVTGKTTNTSFVFSPEGEIIGRYDKLHLAKLRDSNGRWKGEEGVWAGNKLGWCKYEYRGLKFRIGMAVCYDLRFPELFYALFAKPDVWMLCIPSAFYTVSGPEHWISLLKARAIENQAYVIAPNQTGIGGNNHEHCGNSVIIDPWGRIMANAGRKINTVITTEIDMDYLMMVRAQIPSRERRRLNCEWSLADS